MTTDKISFKFMGIYLFLFAVCVAVFFGGCARQKHWTKKELNQEEFDRDIAKCNRESSSSTHIVDYAYSTDLERGLDRSMTNDNLMKKCMYSKGYKLEDK